MNAFAPQPQHVQRLKQRRVNLGAGDNFDWRRTEESILDYVPAFTREQCAARRGERGEICHRRARDQSAFAIGWQTEGFASPANCDFFQLCGDGRHYAQSDILAPGRGEAVGGHCGGQSSADDETERASAGGGYGGGGGELIEHREDSVRVAGRFRERFVEILERGECCFRWRDSALVSSFDVA